MNNMRLNQYEWDSENGFLGHGAFADVYRGVDSYGNPVALKIYTGSVIKATDSGSLKGKYTLENEFKKGKDLSHTNIIRYIALDYLVHKNVLEQETSYPVLIMEYADGGTLSSWLKSPVPPSQQDAVKIITEVLRGLEYLHEQGIIHRDLKPDNILFKTDRKGNKVVKIVDFGISRDVLEENVGGVSTTAGVGTTNFMAPEQFFNKTYGLNGTISNRTDLWAVGVIFYRLLTGKLPFNAVNNKSYEDLLEEITQSEPDFSGIPPQFIPVIKGCLQKKAANRYQNAWVVLKALEGVSTSNTPANDAFATTVEPSVSPSDHTSISPPPKSQASKQALSQNEIIRKHSAQKRKNHLRNLGILVAVLVTAGVIYRVYNKQNSDKETNSLSNMLESFKKNGTDTTTISAAELAALSPNPVNPTLKAAVEIENNPVNKKDSPVITLVNVRIKIVAIDPDGAWSLKYSKVMFASDDSKSSLKRDLSGIIDTLTRRGVIKSNIHFLVADSLYTGPGMQRFNAVLNEMRFDFNRIDAQTAASDILEAAFSKENRSKGFVLDMESQRSLLIYKTKQGGVNVTTTYGPQYYKAGVPDSTVSVAVGVLTLFIPPEDQQLCLVIGDAGTELTKLPSNFNGRFTNISAPAIDQHAEADIKGEQTIYNAIYKNSTCRQFLYDWQADAAIGFLLRLN